MCCDIEIKGNIGGKGKGRREKQSGHGGDIAAERKDKGGLWKWKSKDSTDYKALKGMQGHECTRVKANQGTSL